MRKTRLLQLVSVVLLVILAGCPPPEEEPASETQRRFDEVWTAFDEDYSYFTYKGIDWDDVRTRYRPDFKDDLTANEFAGRLSTMLDELHDWHVWVQRPDGEYLGYTGTYQTNYPASIIQSYARGGAYTTLGDDVIFHADVSSGKDANPIAHIIIDTLDTEQFSSVSDTEIEALFVQYADADGMILDIRANSGGNENNAVKFASRFTDEPVVYGYTKTRNGPGHNDFAALVTKTLEPSTDTHYDGIVVGLIGQKCMSSAEWFTAMLRACPNVILIGDTTRGASANPDVYSLANGVNYSVSRWVAYAYDPFIELSEIIEDNGIEPDFPIDPDLSYDDTHDYVLEEALDWIFALH